MMNPRLEVYRSGAGLTVAHVYSKKGGRVAVLDPHRRARAAILKLLFDGVAPRETARRLGIPFATVCALALPELERRAWKKSNRSIASVGKYP